LNLKFSLLPLLLVRLPSAFLLLLSVGFCSAAAAAVPDTYLLLL
jgi:hypothetical protein